MLLFVSRQQKRVGLFPCGWDSSTNGIHWHTSHRSTPRCWNLLWSGALRHQQDDFAITRHLKMIQKQSEVDQILQIPRDYNYRIAIIVHHPLYKRYTEWDTCQRFGWCGNGNHRSSFWANELCTVNGESEASGGSGWRLMLGCCSYLLRWWHGKNRYYLSSSTVCHLWMLWEWKWMEELWLRTGWSYDTIPTASGNIFHHYPFVGKKIQDVEISSNELNSNKNHWVTGLTTHRPQ